MSENGRYQGTQWVAVEVNNQIKAGENEFEWLDEENCVRVQENANETKQGHPIDLFGQFDVEVWGPVSDCSWKWNFQTAISVFTIMKLLQNGEWSKRIRSEMEG